MYNAFDYFSSSGSDAEKFLKQIFKYVNPANYLADVGQDIRNVVDSIARGAQAIYDKYGRDAVNAVKKGLEKIDRRLSHLGSTVGSGFKVCSLTLTLLSTDSADKNK